MEDPSRRQLFQIIGSSLIVSPAFAQHVHSEIAAVKSLSGGATYVPKKFNRHNFLLLRKLGEIIIPGSTESGAAEYIDFLASHNDELAAIFNGGFGWLDNYMQKTYGADFLAASEAQRTEVVDKLAYTKNSVPAVAAGVPFWTWTRNMVVDAYYTSPVGVKDIGFMGNGAMSSFSVPKEAVDYALKRSPFANEG
ncbi:MAG: Gluconate 2-dehydrogenase subunit 3 precursor [Bryobacterales bacterium]|nr:Gluconate 2-dehydrogenase subunit 3 precursor [Bryobacterales bacterium]